MSCVQPSSRRVQSRQIRKGLDVPTLEFVSIQEAQLELSLSGQRGVTMRQYIDFINQVEAGQAGKLTPDEGETTAALRRRLGAATPLLGKNLFVKRQGDVVFFWEDSHGPGCRRRRKQNQV